VICIHAAGPWGGETGNGAPAWLGQSDRLSLVLSLDEQRKHEIILNKKGVSSYVLEPTPGRPTIREDFI
jgi:hypothetical protein